MGILQLLKALLPLLSNGKAAANVIVFVAICAIFAQYTLGQVEIKHQQALAQIQALSEDKAVSAEKTKALLDSMREIKNAVIRTEERVWEISQDMYMLTGKHHNAGGLKNGNDEG